MQSGKRNSSVVAATIRADLRRKLDVAHPQPGDVVDGQYEVLKKLGEGGFGVVFEVKTVALGEIYAMKIEIEKPPEDEIGMELESTVLKRGQGLNHFLRYVDSGHHGVFSYFVMQLAGPSLSYLQKKCYRRRFSNDTTTRLAMQCLQAVQNVHLIGFLHRDIKPSNFMLGAPDTADDRTVYIMDFGLVRRYRLKDGTHRPQREWGGFRGSYEYASPGAHKMTDLGRKDDMWNLLYSLVKMRTGKLPWNKFSDSDPIYKCKKATTREQLLVRMEPEYFAVYDHIAALKYASEPSYALFRDQLDKIWRRKNYSNRTMFDWERSAGTAEHSQQLHNAGSDDVETDFQSTTENIGKGDHRSGGDQFKCTNPPEKVIEVEIPCSDDEESSSASSSSDGSADDEREDDGSEGAALPTSRRSPSSDDESN